MALKWISKNKRQFMWAMTAVIMISLLLHPLGLPIPVSPEITLAYNYLNSLPAGSHVLILGDVGAGYWYECSL
jgi:hypothetical protein